jgi:hypothetical protein
MATSYSFIHLPSTGGTTLWDILNKGCNDSVRRLRCGDIEHNEQAGIELLQSNPGQFQVIGGHVRAGFLDHVAPDIRYFTVLRDPVERIISAYFRKVRNNLLPAATDTESLVKGISDFAERQRDQVANFLLGKNWRTTLSDSELDSLLNEIDKRFDYIGFMNNFDDTIVTVGRLLNWEKLPLYDRRNQGGNKSQISVSVKAELRSILSLEQAIYDHFRSRYINDLAHEKLFVRLQHFTYRWKNNAYQTFSKLFKKDYAERYVKFGKGKDDNKL